MFEAQLLEPESIIAVDPGDLILLQGKVRHPPLFPIIAPLVSSFSMATRVSLRIASLSVEAVFDSFKYSALASLGLGRRTLVSAINSARTLHFLTFGGSKGEKESDTYFLKVLDQYTDQGVYFAHTVFSLAELLSLTTFHLYSSTIRFSIRMAEDVVHLFDGLFGDTEPSKALAAFICIFINELKGQDDALGLTKRFGKIYALGMVTKAMTAYCCLQYLNRRRWKEMVKLKLLYRTVFPKSKGIYDPSAPVKLSGMFSDPSPQAEKTRVLSRVASVDYLSLAHCVHLKPAKFDDDFVIDQNLKFNRTKLPRKRFHSGPDLVNNFMRKVPSDSISQKTVFEPPIATADSACLPVFEKASRYVKFAAASYGPNFLKLMGMEKPRQSRFAVEDELHQHYSLANHADIPVENILISSHDALATLHAPKLIAPVHYVIVDPATNCIVVSLRGTLGLSDIMTDLIASYDPFTYHEADGYVHSGIYHSAKALSEGYLKLAVIEALEKNPDYDLVITGHSLGGGCAALLTLIWSKRIVEEDGTVKFITNTDLGFPSRIINAFVYACPAIMSSQLSQYVCGLITTVIYRNDIVPRLSLGLIRDFRNVTISLCNEQGLAEGVIGKVLGIFREYQAEVADDPKDDLWYWALLKTLRADMRAEKLYPPGTVYWINAADGLDPNPVPPSMTELLISLVEDVEDAFSEIYFSTSMFTDQYFYLMQLPASFRSVPGTYRGKHEEAMI